MRRRDALRAGVGLLAAGPLATGEATASGTDADSGTGSDTVAGDTRRSVTDEYAPLGRLDVRGTREAVVSADGKTAYLALGDGYATVDVSEPTAPTLLAERREVVPEGHDDPLVLVNDVSVSGDTLAVVAPAHGRSGVPRGLLVVDVSDPAAPVERGFHPTEFPIHNCHLDGRHCYLTGNGVRGNPLVVVDTETPAEVGRWSLLEHESAWAEVSAGLRVLHDVVVHEGVAALAYWDAGTYLLDVSEPAAPSFLGRAPAWEPADLRDPPTREGSRPPGNHHYATFAPDGNLLAVGKETWAVRGDDGVVGGPSGVTLYDVSDPTEPLERATVAPPATPDPTFGGTWTTAHNLAIAGETLYTSWYQGGVKRHDVSDPTAPVEESWWADPDAGRFWTAVPGVADAFFLAPSMGTRSGAPAGLWTFPDEPGTGGALEPFRAAARETATPTRTAVGPAHGSPTPTSTPTLSPTPSSTASPTRNGSAERATAGGDSTAAAPGFGVGAGLAGLAGALGVGLERLARARTRPDAVGDDLDSDPDRGDADGDS